MSPVTGAEPARRTATRIGQVQRFNNTVKTIELPNEQLANLRRSSPLEIDDDLEPMIAVQAICPMKCKEMPAAPTDLPTLRITQKKGAVIPHLEEGHEQMIRTDADKHLLEIIYGLPKVILESIDNTYEPTNLQDYLDLEREWFKVAAFFLGQKLHKSPPEAALLAELDRVRLTLRFRVYYVLTRPGEVKRKDRDD